jgi:hypothetical protein
MKRFTQSIGGRGRLRAAGAVLTLAGAITAVVVLLIPTTASGRTACPGFGSRVGISKFDPHAAKAGSNTLVTVWGSHLGEVIGVAVGPKGKQTFVKFDYSDNTIQFTVPSDAVSGPIFIESCTSSAWSKSSLRV